MNDQWAYIDPATQAATVANVVPDNVTMWWPVPPDTDPNCIAVGPDGEIIILPAPRDYPWQEPDLAAGGWIDTRSADEREAALTSARATSSLTRIDFLLQAVGAGIVTQDDALAAAKGDVPPSLASLVSSLSPAEQFEARIRWAAATTIQRLDPFILDWAAMLGVSEEQLDQIFGVAGA